MLEAAWVELRVWLHQHSGITLVTASVPRVTLQRITDIFIISPDREAELQRGPGSGSQGPAGGNGLSHHICYLLLISCHVIIQKCKLTAAKLSRKLTGLGVTGDAGDRRARLIDARVLSNLLSMHRWVRGPSADTIRITEREKKKAAER